MKTAALAFLLLTAVGVVACGNDTQTPTTATPVATELTNRVFTGTLPVGGSAFFSFTPSQPGTATAMLASLTVSATGRTLALPVGLGFGVPGGTDCGLLTSKTATPALVPQIMYLPQQATYCVRIYDTGALTTDAAFAVRISYP